MAKEFSLKGTVTFLTKQATGAIKEVDSQVLRLQKNTQRIGSGFRQVSQGMAVVGAGGVVAGAGIAKAIRTSADFEQQLARVSALAGATDKELALLTNTAKRLGATTEFTGIQAGQGLEFLALAGFKAKDAASVLPTILDTAAAGALDLGRASDIVTDSMSSLGAAFSKDFNTPVERATRLADVMALAQSKSNTNIGQLGEAIKFGGGALAGFGIPMTQIIAGMGRLADAGLKGSLGGTALTNMFNKLTKPSKDVTSAMSLLGVNMEELPLDDLPGTVGILSKALNKLKDPVQRQTVAIELFGVRGVRAFNALNQAGEQNLRDFTKQLDQSGGSAKRIADIQRNTFNGLVKSFQSATEGILIEIGDFFTKSQDQVLPAFKGLVGFLQNLGSAFQFVNMGAKDQQKALENMKPEVKGLIAFAQGFKEGISEAFTVAKTAFKKIREFMKSVLPPGEEGTAQLGKMIAKFGVLLALTAPLIAGFIAFAFAGGAVFNMFFGMINVLKGTIGLFTQFGGILIKMIPSMKTVTAVGTFLGKSIGFIGKALMWVGTVAAKALVAGFGLIKVAVAGLAKGLIFLVTNPIGWVILGIVALVAAGIWLWKNWKTVTEVVTGMWITFTETITGLWDGMVQFFKTSKIGQTILKVLTFPIRAALTPLMEIINFLLKSRIARNLLGGERVAKLQGITQAISLVPRAEDEITQETSTPTVAARTVQEAAIEGRRLSQPRSADSPTQVVEATQQPAEFNGVFQINLDNEKIAEKQMKLKSSNSERAGGNSTNPKNRSLNRAAPGGFAPGFSR